MPNFRFPLVLGAFLLTAIAPTYAADSAKAPDESATIATQATELQAGQKAPALNIVDSSGKRRQLSEAKGAVLLTFFPRCFTGNCTFQLASLRDNYEQLQKAGVQVWAISTDAAEGPRGQRAFRERHNLPFPLLPDTDRKICLAFGAVQSEEQMATRMSILIGKDGTILWIDKQINPRTHGTDVLARLKADDEKSKEAEDK